MTNSRKSFPVSFSFGFPLILLGSGATRRFNDSGSLSLETSTLILRGEKNVVSIPVGSIQTLRMFSSAQSIWRSKVSLIETLFFYALITYAFLSHFTRQYIHGTRSLESLLFVIFIFTIILIALNAVMGALTNAMESPIIQISYGNGSDEKKLSFCVLKSDGKTVITTPYDKERTKELYRKLQDLFLDE